MIKAAAFSKKTGRTILLIGLSHANLDRLRADGLNGFIKINGEEMKMPVDVIITAAETESVLAEGLSDLIGPDTEVKVDPKLKQ